MQEIYFFICWKCGCKAYTFNKNSNICYMCNPLESLEI